MLRLSWKIRIALILTGAALLLTLGHILVFHDPQTLFFYLALDVVFVPVQVLLVSIVIEQLLSEREREGKLRRLNTMVNAFMGEVGNQLLRELNAIRCEAGAFDATLQVSAGWTRNDYRQADRALKALHVDFCPDADDFIRLRHLLIQRRSFILSLLQNPVLFEHEPFTNLLWAVCHLTEELDNRRNFAELPPSDIDHLNNDIRRAYHLLATEWLHSLQHLQKDFPYIFSLSVRTNPFSTVASPIVR